MRLNEIRIDPLEKPLSQRSISNLMGLIHNNLDGDGRAAGLAKSIQSKWESDSVVTNKLSDLGSDIDQLTKMGLDLSGI